jgi:hypothetical protein
VTAIFENAVGSIKVGVQDFRSTDDHRHVSAVRNYYAGILLLAKEALVRRFPNEDPDQLLASNLKPIAGPNGTVTIIPAARTTIDFATIGRRFKDLGIPFDAGSLKELNEIRNDLEHRFSPLSRSAIVEAIAKGFSVAAHLFRLIDESPVEVLGNEWQIMLETRELFDAELATCRESTKNIDWRSGEMHGADLECPECSSSLVQQSVVSNTDQDGAQFSCRACGEDLGNGEVIQATISSALAFDAYTRFKDAGEDGPVFSCPECGLDTYVDFEGACANCGHEIEGGECAICGEPFPLSDLVLDPDMSLCSYHQYVMNKDD